MDLHILAQRSRLQQIAEIVHSASGVRSLPFLTDSSVLLSRSAYFLNSANRGSVNITQ